MQRKEKTNLVHGLKTFSVLKELDTAQIGTQTM